MISFSWFFPYLSRAEVAQLFQAAFEAYGSSTARLPGSDATSGMSWPSSSSFTPPNGSVMPRTQPAQSGATGRFLVYLADENAPKLTLEAKYTDNSGQQRTFAAQIECEIFDASQSLMVHTPRFCVGSPVYKSATMASSIGGAVALFQACTGWKPISQPP